MSAPARTRSAPLTRPKLETPLSQAEQAIPVDQERGEQLPGNPERHERGHADARRQHDVDGDVNRAEQAAADEHVKRERLERGEICAITGEDQHENDQSRRADKERHGGGGQRVAETGGRLGIDGRLKGDKPAGKKRDQGEREPLERHGWPSWRQGVGSEAMRADTILSGAAGGSPRLILSTFSMPSITRPHTV